MDQHRARVARVAHVLEHRQEVGQLVAVDGPDVIEPQLLEQGAAGRHPARVLLGALGRHLQRARQLARELLADMAQAAVLARRQQAREISAHGADRRRDRHVVVVEDDDEPAVRGAGVVHGLVGHTRAHGAVTDDADDVVIRAAQVARHREAQACGDRGRGVRGAEGVVLAFRALGEARQAAALTQGADAVAPAGEDLVRVALMADVPDQLVPRRIEHVVQGGRELDHPQSRAQVAAGYRDHVDGLGAQLVGQLPELLARKLAKVFRRIYCIQEWRFYGHYDYMPPTKLAAL